MEKRIARNGNNAESVAAMNLLQRRKAHFHFRRPQAHAQVRSFHTKEIHRRLSLSVSANRPFVHPIYSRGDVSIFGELYLFEDPANAPGSPRPTQFGRYGYFRTSLENLRNGF